MPIIKIDRNGNEKEISSKVYINSNGDEKEFAQIYYIDGSGNEHEILGNRVINLGLGQSFNIKNIYSKWQNLTNDNFFILSSDVATHSGYDGDTEHIHYWYDGFDKNYQNGVLTSAIKVRDGSWYYANVNAVLVPKPEKLISLGVGKTFDVSNISGYQNFTENNFLIKTINGGKNIGIRQPLNYTATNELIKSYNSSTGVLTCYGFFRVQADYNPMSIREDVDVYLTTKAVQ